MIERELADGEIVEEWRLPATPERKAAADAAFERVKRDTAHAYGRFAGSRKT